MFQVLAVTKKNKVSQRGVDITRQYKRNLGNLNHLREEIFYQKRKMNMRSIQQEIDLIVTSTASFIK